MRTAKPRYPRKKDVAVVLRAIQSCLPLDREPVCEWRTSQSGAPNYRVNCSTNRKSWTVDIYAGSYMVVQVMGLLTEVQQSVPSLVAYLCRMLKVQRIRSNA